MRFLSIGEHALEVPVQSPHDADARQHRGPAVFRDEDQGLYGRAPFRRAPAGKLDCLVERPYLAVLSQLAASHAECPRAVASYPLER